VQVHKRTVCCAVGLAIAFHFCILWVIPSVVEWERSSSDIAAKTPQARIKGSAIDPSRQKQTIRLRVVILCLNYSILYSDFPRYTQMGYHRKVLPHLGWNFTPKGNMSQGNKTFEPNCNIHSYFGRGITLRSYFTLPYILGDGTWCLTTFRVSSFGALASLPPLPFTEHHPHRIISLLF
jgi:hypothetical protein